MVVFTGLHCAQGHRQVWVLVGLPGCIIFKIRVGKDRTLHKDTGLAHRLKDVALALHAIGCDRVPENQCCVST